MLRLNVRDRLGSSIAAGAQSGAPGSDPPLPGALGTDRFSFGSLI
jgi:hypothetical protein